MTSRLDPRAPLLGEDDAPAYELANGDGGSNVVLVCDHASHRVPRSLGTLGLAPSRLSEHIGWDPGAADVARHLSAELDAPLVSSGFSRLVIDCNRPLRSPQSIPGESDGVSVPGNLGLSSEEKALRASALFQPYHDAITRLLEGRRGRPTLLLSIHSFAPVLAGRARPWEVGVSARRERGLASRLVAELRADPGGWTVGDDEPYAIDDELDFTIPVHVEARGLPGALIEIRQDGIDTPAGARAWAGRLAEAIRRTKMS
ncbi:MAG: N-formylglutamate amidohydrolase [Myxococcales bacterium]|nr:N-formylglutamate amidohydrolase [Myxococcales bacterium]